MSTLRRLTIEDYGLIARAELDFDDGLTVVTGETGSGKTMLLGALGCALGARVESDAVRRGAARARVALEIDADSALRDALAAAGIELAADDDVIVVREVLAAGRSQARINGVPVSASQLRALLQPLVDVVGQHEAQRLISPPYALDVLDRFAGAETLTLRVHVQRAYDAVRDTAAELHAARSDDGRAAAQLEFARFALAEIDAARIEPDEDQRLRERRDVLANAERIADALATARAALEDERGAVDTLGDAATALNGIARYGDAYAELGNALGALQAEAGELAARCARAADDIDADPSELEFVTGRLNELAVIARKYGNGSLAAALATRDEFVATLDADAGRDARVAELERRLNAHEAELRAVAAELTAVRRTAASALASAVADELRELAMPAARLTVALEPLEAIGPRGAERAELRFSANPGEPERPLARIASGGERSRVLLALVVVIADRRDRTVLVFDEVDAGIGGATAGAVGARLARLATAGQVVCVTHLAQIASLGHVHAALRKSERAGLTEIDVVPLAGEARRDEIARMLSGETSTASREHAATLLSGR